MMGFLAPWMLLGVLTAAIPIALHLIQRHKPVVVHWAAMDFLLQSIRETRSASRLRDMILLACRVLLLALAAFALSRPLFGWFSGSGPVDLALLLDISGSMATSESTPEGPRTRLELLKTEAALLLQSLPSQQSFAVPRSVLQGRCHRAVENQPQRGGSNPASLRCLFDRVFEVEGQESVGGWIAG